MSKKGGYKVVDFKNVEIKDSAEISIDGIYNAITKTNGKPVLFSGVNYEGKKFDDFFATPVKTTGGVVVKLYEEYDSSDGTMTYYDLIIATDDDVIVDVAVIKSASESVKKSVSTKGENK